MTIFSVVQSEADILLRNELDDLAKKYPDQLKVWYTVDKATEGKYKYFYIHISYKYNDLIFY